MKVSLFVCSLLFAASAQSGEGARCQLEPQTGPCRAYMIRFYFNPYTSECHEFIYGGCGGNENRFISMDECFEGCRGMRREKSADCRKPPDSGPCRGHLQRFYYDEWTDGCERFEYGGCRGNGNNFRSFQECMATCSQR